MSYVINGKMYGNAEILAEATRIGRSTRTVRRRLLLEMAGEAAPTRATVGTSRRLRAIRDLKLRAARKAIIGLGGLGIHSENYRNICRQRAFARWDLKLVGRPRCGACGQRTAPMKSAT